jgi:hypothetical protein
VEGSGFETGIFPAPEIKGAVTPELTQVKFFLNRGDLPLQYP